MRDSIEVDKVDLVNCGKGVCLLFKEQLSMAYASRVFNEANSGITDNILVLSFEKIMERAYITESIKNFMSISPHANMELIFGDKAKNVLESVDKFSLEVLGDDFNVKKLYYLMYKSAGVRDKGPKEIEF